MNGKAPPLAAAVALLAALAVLVVTAAAGGGHTPAAAATPTTTPTATPVIKQLSWRIVLQLAADGPPEPPPQPPPGPGPGPLPHPEPRPEMVALQHDMADAIASYWSPGSYAVAVTDLQTGETVSVNGDQPRLSGCVMNLLLLMRVALDLQEGRYDEGPAGDLISQTTWSSNASTAYQLYVMAGDGDVLAGVRRVDAFIREALGLTGTVIDHPPGAPWDTLGRDENNWLTAEDVNIAYEYLWRESFLTRPWRDYLLERLATVKPGLNYLTAYVPDGSVSHKNGFFVDFDGYIDNDAGIVAVDGPNGQYAYAIGIYSQGVPDKYADVPLGQELSLLAWRYFDAQYGAGAQVTPPPAPEPDQDGGDQR